MSLTEELLQIMLYLRGIMYRGYIKNSLQEKVSLKIHNAINDEQFIDQCKDSAKSFTRDRVFSFSNLMVFIMTMLRRSLQRELVDFLDTLKSESVNIAKVSKAACLGIISKKITGSFEYRVDNSIKIRHQFYT